MKPRHQEIYGRLERPERVFVVSGPSGVGKNTIVRRLCRDGSAVRAVTATSRPPRAGEVDGEDYCFTTDGEFEEWLRKGLLLEHTRYCDHYYGTPAASVNRACESGLPVVLVIDVDGAAQLKRRWPSVRLIFVAPPDEEALEQRLRRRGDTSAESIEGRLERARKEMAVAGQYDWVVVNDELERAVEEFEGILTKEAHGAT